MLRRITLLLTSLALVAVALVSAPTPAAQAADKDCSDFGSQAAAQDFFINAGGPDSDPHDLDRDGDGIACDSNPCPCSSKQGNGGGGGEGTGGGKKAKKTLRQRAVVVKVTDGDTIKVRLLPRGPKRDVRFIGIDTPEVYGGEECGGPEASASAKRILPRGTRVLLTSDPSQAYKDRYGRLLRYVKKGSKDVNRLQLLRGHAEVYVYDKPFKRVKSYRAAQKKARAAGNGMWGNC